MNRTIKFETLLLTPNSVFGILVAAEPPAAACDEIGFCSLVYSRKNY